MSYAKFTDLKRFEGCGRYGVPVLRADMLAALPDDFRIETWGGLATRKRLAAGENVPGYWFHNWRNADEHLLPFERTILGFYQDDYKFTQCYETPQGFLRKMLIDGPMYVVTPNYSMWFNDPLVVKVWATYRARWCGRYWQDNGFKIIPDVAFAGPESLEFCCDGIPIHAPLIAMQIQTGKLTDEELRAKKEMMARCLEILQPGKVLLYGCRKAEEFIKVIEASGAGVLVVMSQLESARKFRSIE